MHKLYAIIVYVLLLSGVVFHAEAVDEIEITIGSIDSSTAYTKEENGQQLSVPDSSAKPVNLPVSLKATLEDTRWLLSINADTNSKQVSELYSAVTQEQFPYDLQGDMKIDLQGSGLYPHALPEKLRLVVRAKNLNSDLNQYSLASEHFTFDFVVNAEKLQQGYNSDFELSIHQGVLAWKDYYLEPVAGTLKLSGGAKLSDNDVSINALKFSDPGGLDIIIHEGHFDHQSIDIEHYFNGEIHISNAKHAYHAWLKPYLTGTALSDLETAGEMRASFELDNRLLKRLSLQLDRFQLADNAGRFALYDLQLESQLTDGLEKGFLQINWGGAELYRLLFGKTPMRFDIDQGIVKLANTTRIPLYDGELEIFSLSLGNLFKGHPDIQFDGVLTPVSLSSLTHALGWPSFSGKISGVIPSVTYQNDKLNIDGVLLARAFDGTFKIQNLQVNQLLSRAPYFSADFFVDDLDLKMLTETFNFGRVEGKLSGHIAGMEMVSWQPRSFDAFFYTPEDDDSSHIISQRAVDNLTSLSGSDIGSILSRGYLRFFENFRYDRLGIGCILRNNVCRMNGIAAAKGSSYYIVKSGVLPPRLDIIGYSHEVDWLELRDRLQAVMSDGPVIIQ